MVTKKTLFLFDIDGTLIDAGKAAGAAFEEAFFAVFGIKDSCKGINKSGKTDLQILDSISQKLFARAFTLEEISTLNAVYSAKLSNHLQADPPQVLPGVRNILTELRDSTIALLALQTGNIAPAAKAKLSAVGLWSFFRTGGFGDYERSRSAIVHAAYEKCLSCETSDIIRTCIIGDSPGDITAAKDNNFMSIAVASGSFGKEDLALYSPDYVLGSLTDWDQIKHSVLQDG